ncbi:phosphatidylinositol 4-phosphate 5-kinase 5 [Canna indica]|uniref:Phosphatidylinositol 4-phosphate 5-kinase 5 n=1 Tax=Canna indica TaxID=4628 RepID=A0AAQ3Q5Z1_9LILI|nr:phosphatidylinositol 4-phosphate 5-kinase 5 [Canna indica]
MHHKRSEPEVGKESFAPSSSSGFHPQPPLPLFPLFHPSVINPNPNADSSPHGLSVPHKRPIMTPSSPAAVAAVVAPSAAIPRRLAPSVAAARSVVRHILRRLHFRFRLFLLLSFPSLYLLLSSSGGSGSSSSSGRSFLLDFISAVAFSSVLLFVLCVSLNALPLPSFRLLLSRSSSLLPSYHLAHRPSPVLWSIGSSSSPDKLKADRRPSSGSDVQVYNNGDVYEGEFHRGKCSGSGVYYYYMSGRYEGDWVDGKYDGYGVETWARGSRYRGQYRQGLRHGFGVYRFYTGDVYAGEWSNGQSHGCGVHTCEDGSRYVGEFKWGVKHGLGHYHFRNGDTYAGEYFADKMHGFGVYRFANGHRYEGAWHEGKRQGLGMYTFRNGETQSGHWQNGFLDTLSTQSINLGSPVAVNHSKVLNAVQEARRAAEKAYDVPRVDDRVNKAVAAANKAANAARVAAVKAVQKRMPNKGAEIREHTV